MARSARPRVQASRRCRSSALANGGTIEADSGTLDLEPASFVQLSGNTLTSGTWNALDGATLEFPKGTAITTNEGNITLGGAGATVSGITGLASSSGSFSLTGGSDFTTTGGLTNSGSLTVGAGSTLTVNGNFTQTTGATLNTQIGGTPASGRFGQVTVTSTATLAGAFNLTLTNSFGPQIGQAFQVMSFAEAMGTFTTETGLKSIFTAMFKPTSLDLTASANAVDLALNTVSAPTTATAGQHITVNWQATDESGQAATGNWQDSVYLSATPTITAGSTLIGTVEHQGGLGAGASYDASWSGGAPALPPGSYYVLAQIDSLFQVPDPNRDNDVLAAGNLLTLSLPTLTLGTPLSDSFSGADQDRYYQVTVPAGGTLVVSLNSSASSGATALYVSQSALPMPYSAQQSAAADQPNQTVAVPQVLTAGIYYILAHSVSGAAASAAYTITVTQSTNLVVSAISSYPGGNGGNVTVEIDGANLTPAATASLSLGGATLPATAIDFGSATQIYATFNLTGAAVGNYSLKVQQGSQSATAPTPFQVVTANLTPLSIELSPPDFVRSGRTGAVVVTYTNDSNNDVVAPLLDISSTDPQVLFSTQDDPNDYVPDVQILAVAPTGPAGILRPGQRNQLNLTLLSDDTTNGDQIPIQVNPMDQLGGGEPVDWSMLKLAAQPSNIPDAAWNVIWNNVLALVGTTTGSYNAALAQAATYLASLSESTAQVSDVGTLWTFLVSQASADYPATSLASTVDADLATPGTLPLAIDRTFFPSLDGRSVQGIFGLGWATSWQTSLFADSSGNVTINSGDTLSEFILQPNGSYLDTAGEYGTLTLSGGVNTLTDTTGDQFVFLPNGLLNYEQDTNGNRISPGYNAQNQLVTLMYSNPSDSSEPTEQLTLTYNAQGFVSQVADGTGDVYTYSYDSAGHLLSVTAPGNLTTSYTYDTGSKPETTNALLSIIDPDGSQQNFTYDSLGRLSSAGQNGGADPIIYAYPGEAEVTATDAAGDQTTFWFNNLGLPSRVQDPRGALTSYLYDANGNLVGATDAVGNTYQFTYDANGNVTQTVNPLGQTVNMNHDALGDLTSITDAAGNTTQYSYSSAGNLFRITYPDGSQQSFSYDPLGNLSETVEQNGDPISYQYNSQGLVSGETFADRTSQTFKYDPQGNLLTAKTFDAGGTLTGTTTLEYNLANELTQITYPNGQFLQFTYDPKTGQRTQSVDQSGYTVNYIYDSLGRLYQLTDGSGNPIVQYTYDNLDQLHQKLNGNGTSTVYGYDAAGNLTSEVNYAPDGKTVNSSFTYTYDLLGQETSMTDAAGNVTCYAYDATGQLTQVMLPGDQTITYAYNAAGDRTEVVSNGTPTLSASNSDNEVTQVGSTAYTYDANGNLNTITDSRGTTTYTYNDLNQLVSIADTDGATTTFQYSPLGYLVGTTTTSNGSSSQTNYLVDATGLENVVASYNGSGALIADYTYGLGLVSQTGPGGTGYYDFDGSDNTVGITGAGGTYVNQYSYLPFGETTTVKATLPNPFTFDGQDGVMQIGANLFQMRARDYTPATGQFLSNDPLNLAGGSVNLRGYVGNAPSNAVDPTGEQAAHGEWGPVQVDVDNKGVHASYNKKHVKIDEKGVTIKKIPTPIPGVTVDAPTIPWSVLGGKAPPPQQKATARPPIRRRIRWQTPKKQTPAKACIPNVQFENIPGITETPDGHIHLSDTVSVTGTKGLPAPTGYVTFQLLPPPGSDAQVISQTVQLSGGSASTSFDYTATANGPYIWAVFYQGDAKYEMAVGGQNIQVTGVSSPPPSGGGSGGGSSDDSGMSCGLTMEVGTTGYSDNVTAADPNALSGPAGFGTQGFLQPSGTWSYTAQFENDGGVAAQDVTVTEQLNANLDWPTFQLGSFGFGPVKVAVPAGLTEYQTTVSYQNSDGTPLNVLVSLDFNVQTGLLTATFTSLDPATSEAPTGVFDGFLPPNDSSNVGQSYIQYTIQPKAGLPTGTTGSRPATSVCDTHAPLYTNSAVNTIDAGAPTSSVTALPTTETSPSFTVSWSGADDAGGSDIASYDVFVSANGGPFRPFLIATTQTSAIFTGQRGDTYAFYSIATDNVGNVQPAPTSAQASTYVVAPPAFTRPSTAVFAVGRAASFTIATSSVPTAALSESGLLPSGIIFSDNGDGTATLSGTPGPTTGAYTFNVTANDGEAPAVTQVFTLTVIDPPTITSADSRTFAVGKLGSFTVTTTAGLPTATAISKSGTLPSGVTFTANQNGTATLHGTPTAGTGGTYTLTITASNATGSQAAQAFTLTVDQAPRSAAPPAHLRRGAGGHLDRHDQGLPHRGPQRERRLARWRHLRR